MIIGHQRQLRYFERVLARGTLAHAYLFHGPEAIGKKAAALQLAKALFCRTSPKVLGGCSECSDCRQVEALRHPDLIFLSLDRLLVEEDNQREIGIKNIHALKRIFGLSVWGGGWRLAVIDGAEHLSREAQSALLKILEEPAGRSVFFLIIGAAEALLPTIRSRCVAVSFGTVGNEEMLPCLAGIPAGRHSLLLTLAQGRPGVLMRLIRDRAFGDEFRARHDGFEKLLGLNLSEQFSFSEKEGREPAMLESLLEFLLQKFSQDFHQALGAVPRPNFAPQNLGGRAALLKMLLEKLAVSRTMSVNRRLLADSVFFDLNILEAKLNAIENAK